jgi:hypothetical protein
MQIGPALISLRGDLILTGIDRAPKTNDGRSCFDDEWTWTTRIHAPVGICVVGYISQPRLSRACACGEP